MAYRNYKEIIISRSDGGVKTGWQLVGGTWYYLNSQGIMAYNTVIAGYKLGANGDWIK
ncbi:hypothetical protein [Clostridium sp.]|uniref:hypothetical protein n=1 Tax=Clostridium sp. TaxID=1506 RepID=UPI0026157607|nr:hypothetical protein [Clostridium sp.]